jgi:DNA-binding response OmpR family regulator
VEERSLRAYDGGAPEREPAGGRSFATTQPTAPSQPALTLGNLEIRPDEVQALADGRRVGLTVREFQVLLVLALSEDRVVRRADIYGRVWGGEMKHRDRSVDVFVRKVRNKLARAAPGWAYIHTHFGVGYRFTATPPNDPSPDPRPTAIESRPEAIAVEPVNATRAAPTTRP